MEQLVIKGTEKTPEINFDGKSGKLYLGGRSYSSSASDFYKVINDWLNDYIKNPSEKTVLEVNVDYFHSVSIKYLTSMVKKIAILVDSGKSVKITWFHLADENDEDESYDLGKSIEAESKIKFDFVEISNKIS